MRLKSRVLAWWETFLDFRVSDTKKRVQNKQQKKNEADLNHRILILIGQDSFWYIISCTIILMAPDWYTFSVWVGGTLGQQAAEKTAKELEMKIIKFS